MAIYRLFTLVFAVLVGASCPGGAAPTVATAGGRLVVTSSGYRLTLGQETCDVSLELRAADGSWMPVTGTPAGISFGWLTAEQAASSNSAPVVWERGEAGDAVAVAGQVALDPVSGVLLTLHLLCADEGVLVGARLDGTAAARGSLWSPPRLTLKPATWDAYGFWAEDGAYHSGSLDSLGAGPAYAGISPWGPQGDTAARLAAAAPALLARSSAAGVSLGVVFVDYATAWAGAASFLQRHTPEALYFYAGYVPLPVAGPALRWAWLAPVAAGDELTARAQVEALLARSRALLPAYTPLQPRLAAGREPVPDFPAALRRSTPVADIRAAMIYTVNEGTRSAYGMDLARKVGSEVMIRAWFKWNRAPDLAPLRPYPKQAHSMGALFGGGITCSALYDTENGISREELLDMATRGPDGALIDAWDQPGLRHGSLSSPAYLDYLFRWCREQIDAGADYLFMDEHTAALGNREGYDEHSLRDFRKFLRTEQADSRGWLADDPRWHDRYGVELADRTVCPSGTMDSFDYRAFLRSRNLLAQPQVGDNPLGGAWGTFRRWRDEQAWKGLTERLRAYAAGQGRRVLISANGMAPHVDLQVLGVWGRWSLKDGHIDLSENQLPYWRSLVVNGRQVAGDPSVPVVLFHDWGFGEPPFPWLAAPAAEREIWMRTRGAEIFAAGAYFAFPVLGPFGCDAGRDGTLRVMARQAAFYATHRDLYQRSRWLGCAGLKADTGAVSLAAWWSPQEKAVVVHVVNRDVSQGSLQARVQPLVIQVPVPATLQSASAISPDFVGEQRLQSRLVEGRRDVVLPALEAYTVILLRYAEEPDLSALVDANRVWLTPRWTRPACRDFRVLPGGSVENAADLEGFLQGRLHTHLRNPPVFLVNAAGNAELRVHVRAVATAGARLACSTDGGPVQTTDFPDLDGKNIDAPEYDRTVIFPIPSGEHRVALDNTGGDWVSIDWIEFVGPFREPSLPAPVGPDGRTVWEVVSQQRSEDRVVVTGSVELPAVIITSPGGIGAAEVAYRGGAPWPRELHIRLRYNAERAFTRLEGFAVRLAGADSAKLFEVTGPVVAGPEGVDLRVALPARPPDAAVLRLSWVDAYR